jgi:hypothetical protein
VIFAGLVRDSGGQGKRVYGNNDTTAVSLFSSRIVGGSSIKLTGLYCCFISFIL